MRRQVGTTTSGSYRGIAFSGMEFGSDVLPGVEGAQYTKGTEQDYIYAAEKGFKIIRLPFLWERIQTELLGELDAIYKGYIDQNISWAKAHGLQIVLDCHNYGRRKISGVSHIIGDGTLTESHLADLWRRLSIEYKNENGVLAYDIMNEPHDMPLQASPSNYKTTATVSVMSQACIDAIRGNGDSKVIIIPIDFWSNLSNFLTTWAYTVNPDIWWSDSLNKVWVGLHKYFDQYSSGSYQAGAGKYQSEMNTSIASQGDGLETVATWAQQKGVQLFMGEYGIPRQDEAWKNTLNYFMNVMDKYKIHGCYWAMGHLYSSQTGCQPKQNYADDSFQMEIIQKHL